MSMTNDYCKLASGIILSTIWREDDKTRILWITMLAVKDREHRVMASVPGLAAVANISIEDTRKGLLKLMSPDPDSRTKEHEGRRIQEIDGGWFVINGEKFRNYLSKQERNEYQAKLMAERRKKEKDVSGELAPVSKKLAVLAQTEADTETDTKEEESSMYHKDSRAVLHVLNEASGFKFREVDTNLSLISQRLRESGVTFDGVRQMIHRQVKLWKGTEMNEYLRPATLFNKTKFDGYYSMREAPTTPTKSANQKFDPSVQSVDHYLNAIEKL